MSHFIAGMELTILSILQSIYHRCVCALILEYQGNCWFPRWICYLWFSPCTTLLENFEQPFSPIMVQALQLVRGQKVTCMLQVNFVGDDHGSTEVEPPCWNNGFFSGHQRIGYFDIHPVCMHLNCFIPFYLNCFIPFQNRKSFIILLCDCNGSYVYQFFVVQEREEKR